MSNDEAYQRLEVSLPEGWKCSGFYDDRIEGGYSVMLYPDVNNYRDIRKGIKSDTLAQAVEDAVRWANDNSAVDWCKAKVFPILL